MTLRNTLNGWIITIIHLGDFWNQAGIEQHKPEVLAINKETSRYFSRAYDYLSMAKKALDLREKYHSAAIDVRGLDRHAELLIEDALGQESRGTQGRMRRMFASAISPNGLVNYLDILLDEVPVRYVITGKVGTGRTTLVARLAEAAVRRGFFVEAYHCGLDPHKIEHIVIPELGVAATVSDYPHEADRKPGDIEIDTGVFVDLGKVGKYSADIADAEELFTRLLTSGQKLIASAKRTHDAMEQYYTPYMDFDKIAEVRLKTLQQIMDLSNA